MFNFPLASLPAGRGGTSYGISLSYNSKLFDVRANEFFVRPPGFEGEVMRAAKSETGGWRYGVGYKLEQRKRPAVPEFHGNPAEICYGPGQPDYRYLDMYKFVLTMPDGSQKEFTPVLNFANGTYDTIYQDGYNAVDINGKYRYWRNIQILGEWQGCEILYYQHTGGMTLYSTDDSFLRLDIAHDSDTDWTNNSWTLTMPDGTRVTQNEPLTGGGRAGQRIYDRNDNFIEITNQFPDTTTEIIEATDQLERKIVIARNLVTSEDTITVKGVNNTPLNWVIKWKNIGVSREYLMSETGCCVLIPPSTAGITTKVVDKIILPPELGGLSYKFYYNGNENGELNTPSHGFGEVSKVEMPSGATVEYIYRLDGVTAAIPTWKEVLHNPIESKRLIYQTEYNGQSNTAIDEWDYDIGWMESRITGPDGGVSRAVYSHLIDGDGYVWETESPDGTVNNRIRVGYGPYKPGMTSGERLWQGLTSAEFTTIRDAAGNPIKQAINVFEYDMNGNTVRVKEYDWIPFGTPKNLYGEPTGYTPSRITENVYHKATPNIRDYLVPNIDLTNLYSGPTAPRTKTAVKAVEVKGAPNSIFSRSEMSYDDPSTTANLIETKAWDSFKGGQARPYSNPLTVANSITSTVTYNQYGTPLTTTDANGIVRQFIYGGVQGPNGMVTDLYPTQTVTAYGTGVARTSSASYDFYTGLVISATDVDNNVSAVTEYDALGRVIKVRNAAGSSLESWVRTEYDDVNRRVIVRSDLDTMGDGRKVAIQHFDQLGRVRLSRTLENAVTEDPYNEAHGIKVQTRYKTVYDSQSQIGYTYQLTSNPYRASVSASEADLTMGWTLSTARSDGRHSELETFSGSALPAPWGSNGNSTGKSIEDEELNSETTTDEAGKKRRTVTDALGRLVRVDEPDANGNLGSLGTPIQPTNYTFDALGNLTQIVHGGQTRTFTFSSLSRLLSATNPESGSFTYTYDPNGNLLTKTDARGISTTHSYDALNRVTFKNYSDATPDTTYAYDDPAIPLSKGRLTKVSSAISETSYLAFDAQERITASRQVTGGQTYDFGYTYNLDDDLLTQTYPSGKVVKFDYDSSGDLDKVARQMGTNEFVYANSFSYAPHGQIERMKLGNGKWETTQFNSNRQITQIGLGHSAVDLGLLKINYEYGELQANGVVDVLRNNGNLAKQTITVPTIGAAAGFTAIQNYIYDPLDRIKSATEAISGNPTWKQTFLYDRYGNRNFDPASTTIQSTESAIAKVTNPEVLQANNKFKEDQDNDGQSDYLYDPSGNITKNARGEYFTYNAENLLTTVTGSGVSTVYEYDGSNKRVRSYNAATDQATIFVYNADGDLAAEYAVNVPPPANPTISYLTEDALGSVRVTTNSLGEVKARRDFLPFGEELYAGLAGRNANQKYSSNADDTRKKFATYQRDAETGLDFAQSRYYSPTQGRFTSPDEFKGGPDELFDFEDHASDNPTFYADLENPQSLNKYQYVYNNPYKYSDPTGHCPPLGLLTVPCRVAQTPTAQRIVDAVRTSSVGIAIGTAVGAVADTVENSLSRSANAGVGDASCPACTSSQRMGQNLMSKSSRSSRPPANASNQVKNQASGSAGLSGGPPKPNGNKQAANGAKKLSKVQKSKTTTTVGSKFSKEVEVRPGRDPGQSRAEYVTIKTKDGRTIRTYKDSYDRANKFQHRKPLSGGPEGRPPE